MEEFSYRYRTYFFINIVREPPLAFNTAHSFLEWTRTSFEQFLAEFYNILLEKRQVALEMLEVGISSSLWSPKLTTVVQ
jgi:hypothetical protein